MQFLSVLIAAWCLQELEQQKSKHTYRRRVPDLKIFQRIEASTYHVREILVDSGKLVHVSLTSLFMQLTTLG